MRRLSDSAEISLHMLSVCVRVYVCVRTRILFGSLCVFRSLRQWPLSISVAAVMCDCL